MHVKGTRFIFSCLQHPTCFTAPQVAFELLEYRVQEDVGEVKVRVILLGGPLTETGSVTVETKSGTATSKH